MANGIDWFRWHHGSVRDEKFKLIAKKTGASVPDVIAVWAYILEKASANEVRGQFSDLDCEAVDCLYGFPDDRTAEIVAAMEKRGLLSPNHVTRWEERQVKREREPTPAAMTVGQRVAKHRASKVALQAEEEQVTPCNATQSQEKPREEKSREDKKEEPKTLSAQSPDADSPEVQEERRKPAKREPSADDLALASRIFGLILDGNPTAKKPNLPAWADEIRLMREVDRRELPEIWSLFQWVRKDTFWRANVLSPAKLREKWDQLTEKRMQPAMPGRGVPPVNDKFNFADKDYSADAAAMQANAKLRGISITDDEMEHDL